MNAMINRKAADIELLSTLADNKKPYQARLSSVCISFK